MESLPIPNKDGEIWLSLFEDTGRESYSRTEAGSADPSHEPFNANITLNDDIPF